MYINDFLICLEDAIALVWNIFCCVWLQNWLFLQSV